MIKITGDVASVQSAIITGASFADLQNGLVAQKVIARPGEGILSRETVTESSSVPPLQPDAEAAGEEPVPEAAPEERVISCNLCLDPACRRQKGEPRSLCLHAGKRGDA